MKEEIPKTNDVELTEDVSFREMMLSSQVLAGLRKCNFERPSPIQLRAIPIGRCGLDLIIQSKSGTGKTLVFCTIILERYNPEVKAPQSLIVVPTREIALQVETYLNSIGSSCSGFRATSVIGGRDIVEDRKRLNKCRPIVGTPGRILHLIKNKFVCLQSIQTLVLDEADKLVTDDFYSDINILLEALNKNRQIIASSATYANDLDKLIVSFMQNPAAISTSRDTPVLIGVKQFILPVESFSIPQSVNNSTETIQSMWRKVSAVEYILSTTSFKQCILFSNSQFRANSFANYLKQNKWTVELVLGSHDQNTRTETLEKFRKYESRILVTSDLMARGVDIVNVNLVINLDVPSDSSTYLHRIGRCGRFGRRGLAITLASDEAEMEKFRKLLSAIGGSNLVATFPTNLNGDTKFNAWNSNDSPDSPVFELDDLNDSIEPKSKQSPVHNENDNEDFKQSACNESDSIESKNLKLFEVAKLLVDTETTKQQPILELDVDLFANFQCSNVTDDVQSRIDLSTNIFEEFEQSKFDTSLKDLEDQSALLLGQEKANEAPSIDESVHFAEPNHNKVNRTSPNDPVNLASNEIRDERKKYCNKTTNNKKTSDKFSKSTPSDVLWSKLFWKQLSDINQYVLNSNYLHK